jgi:hypothetical protein
MRVHTSIKSVTLLTGAFLLAGLAIAQAPQPATAPAKGVKCPSEFTALWDPAAKVLRCKKEIVSWVVTTCHDKSFASYVVKPGSDSCGPTEVPGVGTPPGAKGTKPVSCAAPGYELITDRTGDRDRCEKVERIFVLPLPAS